jgi:hypothetical protein
MSPCPKGRVADRATINPESIRRRTHGIILIRSAVSPQVVDARCVTAVPALFRKMLRSVALRGAESRVVFNRWCTARPSATNCNPTGIKNANVLLPNLSSLRPRWAMLRRIQKRRGASRSVQPFIEEPVNQRPTAKTTDVANTRVFTTLLYWTMHLWVIHAPRRRPYNLTRPSMTRCNVVRAISHPFHDSSPPHLLTNSYAITHTDSRHCSSCDFFHNPFDDRNGPR